MACSTSSPIAADSNYTSSDESDDVCSLTPSITDYPMRWGRRYHNFKEGHYFLPNDEAESNRLDFQHAIVKQLHEGRLFYSPVKDCRRILDLGTGTGIWAVELADSGLVPNARITGTDLSPIQPSDVPENVSFEIADCTDSDWYRPVDSVDLVFARFMMGCIPNCVKFLKTAKKYIRPGNGWLEIQDVDSRPLTDDDSIPSKWPLKEWEKMMSRGIKRADQSLSMHIAPKLKELMEDAGFVDVHEVVHKVPLGGWPKDKDLKQIGKGFGDMTYDGLSGFSYKVLGNEGLGMSRTEIEVFLASVRKSIYDRDVHAYVKFYTVYGRKPGSHEAPNKVDKSKSTRSHPAQRAGR